MQILVFANSYTDMSGGDKIFAEYSRRWARRGERVLILTNEKGRAFCLRHGIDSAAVQVWRASFADRFGVYYSTTYKTLISVVQGLRFRREGVHVAFSASHLWPDVFAALLAKLRTPRAKWVAACYLITPFPWDRTYAGGRLRALLLYMAQFLSIWVIRWFADGVFTASLADRAHFDKGRLAGRVMAVRGGVDVQTISTVPAQRPVYGAVFLGRFHPQKCLDELIDIWKMVLQHAPASMLALVGAGPLEKKLRRRVADESLQGLVKFLGVQDGVEKYKTLKSSRLFVSASRFDSGNLALDEALACGVPGVVYDLPHFDYPQGVIKVPVGDAQAFAAVILRLLDNEDERRQLGEAATSFAATLDWDLRAAQALNFIRQL